MDKTAQLIEEATPAMSRAMLRANIDPSSVILASAGSQGAYHDHFGIGVFGVDEEVTKRALVWLRAWLDSRSIERTYDCDEHAPDRFGRVWVTAYDEDVVKTHPWRGLSAIKSFSIGD